MMAGAQGQYSIQTDMHVGKAACFPFPFPKQLALLEKENRIVPFIQIDLHMGIFSGLPAN